MAKATRVFLLVIRLVPFAPPQPPSTSLPLPFLLCHRYKYPFSQSRKSPTLPSAQGSDTEDNSTIDDDQLSPLDEQAAPEAYISDDDDGGSQRFRRNRWYG